MHTGVSYNRQLFQRNEQLTGGLLAGWIRFMQWKYPVEVVVNNPALYEGAGAVKAAAPL